MLLHDANMLSIELKPNRVALLTFLEENGKGRRMLLEGVQRLRSFDFSEGNIVLDVEITTGVPPQLEPLRRLFHLSEHEIPDYLQKTIVKIERGDLTLVHI